MSSVVLHGGGNNGIYVELDSKLCKTFSARHNSASYIYIAKTYVCLMWEYIYI